MKQPPSTTLSSTSYTDQISKPFFKTDSIPKANEDSFSEAFSNAQFLKIILDQIQELSTLKDKSVSCLDRTCHNQTSDISSSSEEDVNTDSEEALNVINEAFDDPSPSAINKIRHWTSGSTRNYYPRPIPPDIQYEERGSFMTSQFGGQTVHQWNIDGKYEHEILSTLQEMTIALSAYKAHKLINSQAATALVVGFSGQLKSWWDNFLTNDERSGILNHKYKKTNDRGVEIEEENGAEILIHTITLHFIGNPKEEQASSKTILINLRCPTLTDYHWYKDVFLTHVLKREDGT